ncbi:type II secretion system protein GspL [Vibrio aphrogenes]|uniref:type II secretion system protein GspL n=1 Tax=Vibrio aphrogenes TaxID=1891186 RepID=UPI000B34F601|nr:type II secretion system protein GspL [Vibrio aphrogenes]
MNEFLTIKLSSNPTDPIPWLVWSNSLNDIIASGELADRDQLSELVDYSVQRQVIALLPSSDVLITPIKIPAGAGRQLSAMLPFLMEDELTQDIEKMHFSVIQRQGDQAIVATVLHQYLADWLSLFKSHGITLKKVLPDCLALPLKDNHISAMQIDQQWLLRKSDVKGAAVDEDWLDTFLASGWLAPDGDALHFDDLLQDHRQAGEPAQDHEGLNPDSEAIDAARLSTQSLNSQALNNQAWDNQDLTTQATDNDDAPLLDGSTIYCYSDLPEHHQHLPGKWIAAPQEMMMKVLSQGAIAAQTNLLTGVFKAQSSWWKHWRTWRKVAVAASVFLVLLFIEQTLQVQKMEAQTQAYRMESERVFRSVFPDRQRIPTVSYLKRIMQDEEQALAGGGDQQTSVLGWVAQLPAALESTKTVSIQSIQFDGNRQEIRLNAQSRDFQSFETFRTELAKSFDVSQGQLNKHGDVVQGNYVIKAKGAGN